MLPVFSLYWKLTLYQLLNEVLGFFNGLSLIRLGTVCTVSFASPLVTLFWQCLQEARKTGFQTAMWVKIGHHIQRQSSVHAHATHSKASTDMSQSLSTSEGPRYTLMGEKRRKTRGYSSLPDAHSSAGPQDKQLSALFDVGYEGPVRPRRSGQYWFKLRTLWRGWEWSRALRAGQGHARKEQWAGSGWGLLTKLKLSCELKACWKVHGWPGGAAVGPSSDSGGGAEQRPEYDMEAVQRWSVYSTQCEAYGMFGFCPQSFSKHLLLTQHQPLSEASYK